MALKTYITSITGVDWSQIGDIISRDAAIREGCVFCYDFGDDYSWPGQSDAGSGSVIANLVDDGDDAATGATTLTHTVENGFAFTVAADQGVHLPAAARFVGNTTGFMVVAWVRYGTQTQAANSNVLGFYDYIADDGPYAISTANPQISYRVNGQLVKAVPWTPDSVLRQIALAWVNTDDGWKVRLYIDGVLDTELNATNSAVSQPTAVPSDAPGMGDIGANGANVFSVFDGYRIIGYDLDGWTDAEILDVLKLDYAENYLRFASA